MAVGYRSLAGFPLGAGLPAAPPTVGFRSLFWRLGGVPATAGSISGTATLVFGQTGDLKGAGVLAGTTTVVFGQTGTLDLPPGAMVSVPATIVFGQTGDLRGSGSLSGSTAILFSLFGDIPSVGGGSGGWTYDHIGRLHPRRKKKEDDQEELSSLEIVKIGKSTQNIIPEASKASVQTTILQAIKDIKFKSAREKRKFIRTLQLSDDEWFMMN
jgi:hypothetical protein